MYEVYVGVGRGDYQLLYEDTSMAPILGLIDPVLTLEEGKAGSFRCTVPITHPLYSTLEKRVTEFRVYKLGDLIWKGIIFSEDYDFYKQRLITVSGPLDFLNDTMQTDREFLIESDNDIWEYLHVVLGDINGQTGGHNSKVAENKKVKLGHVGVTKDNTTRQLVPNLQPDKLTLSVDTSTKQAIDNLVKQYGGYIYITYEEDNGYPIPVLNYLKDHLELVEDPSTHEITVQEDSERPYSNQTIIFGENLINLTRTISMDDIATVIVPRGANDEDGNPIDIRSENDGKEYIYVSQALFDKYGWIEKTVHWNDIDTPAVLFNVAKRYATNLQFMEGSVLDIGTLTLSITALDARYYDVDVDSINLSEKVRVYSEYHGTDTYYPAQKIEIHMANPENTVLSLNRTTTVADLSTSISNIEDTGSESPEYDYSDLQSQIDGLRTDLDGLTDWAENTNGYDPYLSGYQTGSADGWYPVNTIWTILKGTNNTIATDKFGRIDLWLVDSPGGFVYGCGAYTFNANIIGLSPPTPVYNTPAYRRKIAGYWVAGNGLQTSYGIGMVNGNIWISGESIPII